ARHRPGRLPVHAGLPGRGARLGPGAHDPALRPGLRGGGGVLMVTLRALAAAVVLVAASARGAYAQGAPPSVPHAVPAAMGPQVHHAPISSAKAHEEVRVTATLDHPELVRSAVVVYGSGEALKQVQLLRSESPEEAYLAVIPAADVTAPGFGYAIEIELTS